MFAITKNPQTASLGWRNEHSGSLCTAGSSSGPSRNELDALEHWSEFQRQDASEGSQTPNATHSAIPLTRHLRRSKWMKRPVAAWGRDAASGGPREKREQEFGVDKAPKCDEDLSKSFKLGTKSECYCMQIKNKLKQIKM